MYRTELYEMIATGCLVQRVWGKMPELADLTRWSRVMNLLKGLDLQINGRSSWWR